MKLKIVVLVNLLLVLGSCQKKNIEAEKRKDVSAFIEKIEVTSLEDKQLEKYLDTIYQKLQSLKNDSITRNLYFK